MDIVYHYPPELFQLLVDTIPLLCRSKTDVLLFFKGAGVSDSFTSDLSLQLKQDRNSVKKFDIVRTILKRLNDKGEATLRERREVLKRVCEFESFSSCWEGDQLKAKGLVAEIRNVVNVKDSFTRMNIEREKESQKKRDEYEAKALENRRLRAERLAIKDEILAQFKEANHQKRGKSLEAILNRLFRSYGILIREAFCLRYDASTGIVEQIDGVIELDGHLYLVEMKWWEDPIGNGDISQHLVRIFGRGHARGIFISASGYTDPAIAICRDSLTKITVALCKLEEIILLLEQERDLRDMLRTKIQAAIIDKVPFIKC